MDETQKPCLGLTLFLGSEPRASQGSERTVLDPVHVVHQTLWQEAVFPPSGSRESSGLIRKCSLRGQETFSIKGQTVSNLFFTKADTGTM